MTFLYNFPWLPTAVGESKPHLTQGPQPPPPSWDFTLPPLSVPLLRPGSSQGTGEKQKMNKLNKQKLVDTDNTRRLPAGGGACKGSNMW